MYNYRYVASWTSRGTREADLFDMDIAFFPRNTRGAHWTLCVAYIVERRIEYLDSMGAAGAECMADVLCYLADEHAEKKYSPLDTSTWSTKSHLLTSRAVQHERLRCLHDRLRQTPFLGAQLNFSQSDMEFYRKRITISVLNGTI